MRFISSFDFSMIRVILTVSVFKIWVMACFLKHIQPRRRYSFAADYGWTFTSERGFLIVDLFDPVGDPVNNQSGLKLIFRLLDLRCAIKSLQSVLST